MHRSLIRVQQVTEYRREQNLPTSIAFVDLTNAFKQRYKTKAVGNTSIGESLTN